VCWSFGPQGRHHDSLKLEFGGWDIRQSKEMGIQYSTVISTV